MIRKLIQAVVLMLLLAALSGCLPAAQFVGKILFSAEAAAFMSVHGDKTALTIAQTVDISAHDEHGNDVAMVLETVNEIDLADYFVHATVRVDGTESEAFILRRNGIYVQYDVDGALLTETIIDAAEADAWCGCGTTDPADFGGFGGVRRGLDGIYRFSASLTDEAGPGAAMAEIVATLAGIPKTSLDDASFEVTIDLDKATGVVETTASLLTYEFTDNAVTIHLDVVMVTTVTYVDAVSRDDLSDHLMPLPSDRGMIDVSYGPDAVIHGLGVAGKDGWIRLELPAGYYDVDVAVNGELDDLAVFDAAMVRLNEAGSTGFAAAADGVYYLRLRSASSIAIFDIVVPAGYRTLGDIEAPIVVSGAVEGTLEGARDVVYYADAAIVGFGLLVIRSTPAAAGADEILLIPSGSGPAFRLNEAGVTSYYLHGTADRFRLTVTGAARFDFSFQYEFYPATYAGTVYEEFAELPVAAGEIHFTYGPGVPLKLRFTAATAGSFTLHVSPVAGFDEDMAVYLKDAIGLLNVIVFPDSEGVYVINVEAGDYYLRFSAAVGVTNVFEVWMEPTH